MAATMNGVKSEDVIPIKDEPADVGTPMSTMSEEVEEEDTGELSMPKDEASNPGVFLTRVPKELWQVLSDTTVSQDEPIQVGSIKVWDKGNGQQEMRLYLKYDLPGLDLVPKDYEMNVTNMEPQNTFLFTEKDLPGYRPGIYNHRGGQRTGVQKRSNFRSRRSIPKKTALAGYSRHEFMLHPIENEEYRRIQRVKREAEFAAAQAEANIIENEDTRENAQDAAAGQWRAFTGAKQRSGQQQAKRQLNKAERLPENVLFEKLFGCFRQYAYWNFKSLVRAVHQPEAYVKETLNKIAVLVKSGQFANTYMLAAQYRESLDMQEALNRSEAAPEIARDEAGDGEGDLKDEGDSDIGDMEDVVLSRPAD
ncbi:hypothetical protein NA57DRAFT_78154 [Rhizodiscina lignyota]|uniref:Transcription initiation factor IIF subunit beta n=1 Tax=Rhizodiscina lignyota TaxID=1504668 RepID=A0A9P4M495_9PEZI|nr:hypothetical protein NA57DRAFT_78154 [Rhizodiscina lignyota]